MTELSWLHLAGCLVVLIAYTAILRLQRTAIFGLNTLNFFIVGSATLSGFVAGTVLDRLPESSPEYAEVISYSVLGLAAMVAGIYLGSRPLIRLRATSPRQADRALFPLHINNEMGWLTFWVGASAELLVPFVYSVPTVSTAVYCVTALMRIGLSVLLLVAINTGRWTRFFTALSVFMGVSIVSSLATGFSFIRFNTLLPLLVIWFVASSWDVPRLIRAAVLFPASAVAIFCVGSAWLEARKLIRGGLLQGLSLMDQMSQFFGAYLDNLSLPAADSIMRTIWYRVDMTEILVAQARHQPATQPYMYGDTLLSSFYTLIPRVLWPDKPVVAGGSAFVSKFTGLHWDAATSVGLPYPFELYANGGPIWVVIGLGVIGYIGARLELKLLSRPKSLGSFWAVALVTAVLTQGGERMDTTMPALVASGVAAYVLGLVIQKLWRDPVWLGNSHGRFQHGLSREAAPSHLTLQQQRSG